MRCVGPIKADRTRLDRFEASPQGGRILAEGVMVRGHHLGGIMPNSRRRGARSVPTTSTMRPAWLP